jgi:hypothetical protein
MTVAFHVTRFVPDSTRTAEFLACLWQGPVPATLRLDKWLYLSGEPRTMLLLWEGDDEAGAYIERAFGSFGDLETQTVTDATPGLAAAFARDLDAFGAWMRGGGADEQAVAAALEVRRLGLESATQEAAAAAARASTRRSSDPDVAAPSAAPGSVP